MARAASRRASRLSRGLTVLVVLLIALLAARMFVAEPLRIRTSSMSPTLVAGQHVLTDKVTRHDGRWHRGDVVAFRLDGSSELLVKRIVALAGDRVGISDGRLVVNGKRPSEPYTDPAAIDSVYFGPVRVPPAHVFVLGDNRGNSRDSRVFGPVATSSIRSRVDAVIWPLPLSRKDLD
jgi:signal peptidase I